MLSLRRGRQQFFLALLILFATMISVEAATTDHSINLNVGCAHDEDCNVKQHCTVAENCQRKSIMPLDFPEIFGCILIISILGFAQASGVGGGTSIMPILVALFLYDTKKSVAIVIILVFSGSLGNAIQLSRDRTPSTSSSALGVPVIDFRLILITLPSLIVGTIYGISINRFLPPLVVCLLLVALLT